MRDKLYFLVSMIIFGAVGVFAKYIEELASSAIALFMSLIGSLCLFLICLLTRHQIGWQNVKKNAPVLLLASIALSGNWIFLFQSYKETTIANAALSYYLAPVLVIMMSPLVLKEKLSLKKMACAGTAFFGLILIVQSGTIEGSGHHLLGIFYGLIAAVFYTVLTLANKFIRNMCGMESTLLQLLLASALLLPYVLVTEGFDLFRISGLSVILILALGIVHTGIGFHLFFTGMRGLQGQSIAVLSFADPVTSLLISALVLGETMTSLQMAGAALLLGSTWVSEGTRKQKAKDSLKTLT